MISLRRYETLIKKNGVIEISEFEPTYEKDPDEKGYYDNPIIKRTLVEKKTLTIGKNGRISMKVSQDIATTN